MRVGIVGIGDIAKKAYLPILSNLNDVLIVPCTRNSETLNNVMKQYHLSEGYSSLDDLFSDIKLFDIIYHFKNKLIRYNLLTK